MKNFLFVQKQKYNNMSYHKAIEEICQMCGNPYYHDFDEICVCHSDEPSSEPEESEVELENCCLCGEASEHLVDNCMCFDCDRDLATVHDNHHMIGYLSEDDPLRFEILRAKCRLNHYEYGKLLMSWYPVYD